MNKILKISALTALLLVIVLAVYKIFDIIRFQQYIDNPVEKPAKYPCPIKGDLPVDDYFTIYTVKKGDTLFSIAKEQLGSTDRVLDIVIQNQDKFPQLSLKNSFIEVGWKLKILKPQYGPYTEKLWKSAGYISEISDSVIAVDWGYGGIGYFYPNTKTQYVGETDFKKGSCVIVTYAGHDNFISIEHQK